MVSDFKKYRNYSLKIRCSKPCSLRQSRLSSVTNEIPPNSSPSASLIAELNWIASQKPVDPLAIQFSLNLHPSDEHSVP